MALFEFFALTATSLLLSYLTLSNILAGYVGELFPASHEIVRVEENIGSTTTVPAEFSDISRLPSSGDVIPRVLIESAEYQRAALIASGGYDSDVVLDQSRPLDEQVVEALVNIFCQYKTKDYIRTTTGTGFFISPKGVVLTNAHVAQFLLLRDVDDDVIDATCVVRTGNPAVARYEAELLYISPAWIAENANLITEETPRGTGERDYALLYVSKSTNREPLPARFPALPVHTELLPRSTEGTSVLTAGYPAEALFRDGARAKLFPKIASTTVGELYTFGSNYADIFSVSASAVGEQGASGGPIVKQNGDTIGLIVTKGDESTEGSHSLRALTMSYVDRTIIDETGYSLRSNMRGDVAFRGKIFNQALTPFLSKLLTEEITEND